MIPVKIIKAIYIRKGPGVSFGFLGVIQPGGNEINMAGTVTGESHKGINTWYYLVNDNGVKQYYWGGGVSAMTPPEEVAPPGALPTELPPAAPSVAVPQWMGDLQLPAIWQHATGQGVGVAVVDTGIMPNLADLPYNTNTFFTYAPGVSLTDTDGHGTNCAGLIGARNKAGKYIGVAPDCNLFVCKISENNFFDSPADTIRYANAINWCAAQKDIQVISVSWGNKITDPAILAALQAAVNNALANNKLVVCAMGESFSFGDPSLRYPACTTGTLGIGAIPVEGVLYPFINTHLFAATTGYGQESYGINPDTANMYGTSQANAVAAGIVALLVQQAGPSYTPDTIRQKLQSATRSVSYSIGGVTASVPVIDGSLLLQNFIST